MAARIVVAQPPTWPQAADALRRHLAGHTDAVVYPTRPRDLDELTQRMRGAASVVHFFDSDPLDTEALLAAHPGQVVVAGPIAGSVDAAAAAAAGIGVYDTPGLAAGSVAEFTIAVMLALTHGVHHAARTMPAGEWRPVVGRDAQGQRLGVIGVGRVGRRVIGLARSIGMDVHAWSPSLSAADAEVLGAVHHQDLEDLLPLVDIVSLHLRLTESTRHILDARRVGLLRAGSLLVNTARAQLVDSDALRTAIAAGHLAGAALDVFDTEPPTAVDPLRGSAVLATPHMAWMTSQAIDRFVAAAAAFAATGDTSNIRQAAGDRRPGQ